MIPHFGYVKWIKFVIFSFFICHYLNKNIPLRIIPIFNRIILLYIKGFSLIKLNKGDSIVGIIPCDDDSTVAIHTSDTFKKVTMNELHVGSSISIGDKVIGTKTGKVVFCSKLPQ